MPRSARKHSSTDVHHVMFRGVDKCDIFLDDDDRRRYLFFLRRALEGTRGSVYAWCLMTNHVHLLVRMETDELSGFMKGSSQSYAMRFNGKYGRSGHLFEQRFRSEPVETDAYFLTVVRYIHQNPVKAFISPDCRYRWSSYGQYLGAPGFCDSGTVIGAFGGLAEFLQFHATVAFEDRCLDIKQEMPDDEARGYAAKVLGEGVLEGLGDLPRTERDLCLRKLKGCMLPNGQVARIANVSPATVSRA